MRLEFFPEAEFELVQASAFYQSKRRGLGEDFVTEVERVAHVLVQQPALGEKLDPIHRRMPLRRFPYAVIYRADGDVLQVVAVAHSRRRPSYWHSRVQER